MQIKKLFKSSFFISRECKAFALLIIFAVCLAYILFAIVAYQNHKNTYKQQYLSQALSMANSYEAFLDNIFRQAEFIGHKISEDEKDLETINRLLRNQFSVGVDLDTTLLGNWIKFKWIDSHGRMRVSSKAGIVEPITIPDKYDASFDHLRPWSLYFDELRTKGHNIHNSYIPISFGVTNRYNRYSGTLAGEINLASLLKYLQRNQQESDILILDENNNILAQSPRHASLPTDFFKKQNFATNYDNFYKVSELDKTLFLAYKKLDAYPFIIVIGGNKQTIFQPLFDTLSHYFCILFVILLILLMILGLFYKRIIQPIISLSSFAKDLLSGDKTRTYIPREHSFAEITSLEQALIQIGKYQNDIELSNKKLNQKTDELENVKQKLEEDLTKLSKSYGLRDNLLKESFKHSETVNPVEGVKYCLEMLFPEIYSRQLTVIETLNEVPELKIKCGVFVKILNAIFARSFMFSSKSSKIVIETSIKNISGKKYVCVSVEDDGMGNENWRKENLKNDADFDAIKLLIVDELAGILQCINRDDSGVKYCILLPYEQEKEISKTASDKIIHLFPRA